MKIFYCWEPKTVNVVWKTRTKQEVGESELQIFIFTYINQDNLNKIM